MTFLGHVAVFITLTPAISSIGLKPTFSSSWYEGTLSPSDSFSHTFSSEEEREREKTKRIERFDDTIGWCRKLSLLFIFIGLFCSGQVIARAFFPCCRPKIQVDNCALFHLCGACLTRASTAAAGGGNRTRAVFACPHRSYRRHAGAAPFHPGGGGRVRYRERFFPPPPLFFWQNTKTAGKVLGRR